MLTPGKLEKIIARGQLDCVLRYGVAGFGLAAAAIMVGVEWLVSRNLTVAMVVAPLITAPLVGIGFGGIMWSLLRGRYDLVRLEKDR